MVAEVVATVVAADLRQVLDDVRLRRQESRCGLGGQAEATSETLTPLMWSLSAENCSRGSFIEGREIINAHPRPVPTTTKGRAVSIGVAPPQRRRGLGFEHVTPPPPAEPTPVAAGSLDPSVALPSGCRPQERLWDDLHYKQLGSGRYLCSQTELNEWNQCDITLLPDSADARINPFP